MELLPEGLTFNDAVKLSIYLNSNISTDNIPVIATFNPETGVYFLNETIYNPTENEIFSFINHFSFRLIFNRDIPHITYKYKIYNLDRINFVNGNEIGRVELEQFAIDDIQRAINKWEAYTKYLNIDFNSVDQDEDIEIYFLTREEARDKYALVDPLSGGLFMPNEEAPGATGGILFSSKHYIVLNTNYKWFTTMDYINKEMSSSYYIGKASIERIISHELGHFLSIDKHEEVPFDNIMSTNANSIPVSLTCIDIEKLFENHDIEGQNITCPKNMYSIYPSDNQEIKIGESIPYKPVVLVTDENINGMEGITVVFYDLSKENGEIINPIVQTNSQGYAQVSDWIPPNMPGEYTIKAQAWMNNELVTVEFTVKVEDNSTSLQYGSFTDPRDGYEYKTIQIGDQVWMAENLKYLPEVSPSSSNSLFNQHYYVYGYEGTSVSSAKATSNYSTYGVLYNWPAAMAGEASSNSNPSGVQGVCPSGWHLPSDAEWSQLTNYLEGESIAGGKLKESGTAHWVSPNEGATNETGFKALPSGVLSYYDSNFGYLGYLGFWWSSAEDHDVVSWWRELRWIDASVIRDSGGKGDGFSVRCVKD